MAGMRPPLVAALLGLVVLGGCSTAARQEAAPARSPASSSSQPPPAAAGGPAVTTLTCRGAIDGGPPPADYETVLGVVSLPTSPASAALGASDSGDPAVPALFAKTGLLVRADTPSELVVAPQPGNRVAIGWGNVSFGPGQRFVVPACPDTYGTGWLAYPGGYWADSPLCLPLTVRASGQEQEVHVGVGASCPGQAPPSSG
jgi:hypothetical protein